MDYVAAFVVSVLAGLTVEVIVYLWQKHKRK